MSRFLFLILLGVAIVATAGSRARSQFVGYVAAGSTAPGDYLRGVGIEAAGMGMYNWNTAVAESIHANTSIRVDQYVREVLRQGRVLYATQRKEAKDRFDANYAAIRKRIEEHPQAIDLMSGQALNAVLDKLDDPLISESAFRQSQARLSIEDLRKITFKLGEKGASFSIRQLTSRDKGRWPVAFQDERYAPERREYERALDDALEHMAARKMPNEVIESYMAATQAFVAKLRADPWANADWRRVEANNYIATMRKAGDLLKIQEIQGALVELDNYGGTSINDLRRFMQRHKLRFAGAESPDERTLYPRLYESFVAVKELVLDDGKGPGR